MSEYSQGWLAQLEKQGLKVMFVAYSDACPVCRRLHGRIFDPLQAPPLPMEQCLTPPCRCRYEAYDLRSVLDRLLTAGIAAVKEQRLDEARELLYQVIDLDQRNEKAWLWLSGVVQGIDERIICLENVLAVNPDHEITRQGLSLLLAQRRQVETGQTAARKIKVARKAIDDIKATQDRLVAVKEQPSAAMTAVGAEGDTGYPPESPLVTEPAKEERTPVESVLMTMLYALLGVLVAILVLAALIYGEFLLR